jgi:endoglucanase
MRLRGFRWFTALISLGIIAAACGGTGTSDVGSDASTPDSGGSGGSGGGAGGNAGAGGSGGTVSAGGSGGTAGAGGGGGSGGTADAGGAGGSGGTTAAGGSGGSAGTGGSGGSGGADAGGAGGSGGTTASGGSGGSAGTGGSGGSGGSGSADAGTGLTPQQVVKVMPPGWNLGNSFDGDPTVTSFGNPAPNQTLINAVHAAGFNTLRLPVTWTDHIGAAPTYTINAAWMAQVVQTAQWAVDAGMYVFVNTHHESDGGTAAGWVTFPTTTAAAATVATEVTAVWTQIATAFAAFDSKLMFECFNEPDEADPATEFAATTESDLNTYLAACVNAIRGTGGANATRIVMIQPVGASPNQKGIQAMQTASIIDDPNLLISIHTYYPTNFSLSETPYAWGSSANYTSMQDSISQQIRVWLPTQPVVIGEWGSEAAQATANRTAHALAYSQDVTTAGMVPVWWDNGGTGAGSYGLFNRTTGAETFPTIISAIMTGVSNGQAAPDTWATLATP